LPYL
jgi:hypothetical protein